MNRITERDLAGVCRRINQLTKSPEAPYAKSADGERMVAQIGNYHISHAYGGVSLHRMVSEGGGVSDVLMLRTCAQARTVHRDARIHSGDGNP